MGSRTAKLIGKGNEILKQRSLGNGSVIAERMAKAKLVSKTAQGKDNLIEVEMTISKEGSKALDELLQTKPKLSADSKKKFEEVTKKLLDNLVDFRNHRWMQLLMRLARMVLPSHYPAPSTILR